MTHNSRFFTNGKRQKFKVSENLSHLQTKTSKIRVIDISLRIVVTVLFQYLIG